MGRGQSLAGCASFHVIKACISTAATRLGAQSASAKPLPAGTAGTAQLFALEDSTCLEHNHACHWTAQSAYEERQRAGGPAPAPSHLDRLKRVTT